MLDDHEHNVWIWLQWNEWHCWKCTKEWRSQAECTDKWIPFNGFSISVQILTLWTHHQEVGIAKCVCEQVSVVSACCKRNGIVSQAQCMCIPVCVDAYLVLVAFSCVWLHPTSGGTLILLNTGKRNNSSNIDTLANCAHIYSPVCHRKMYPVSSVLPRKQRQACGCNLVLVVWMG